jgi:hypothetical protein
MFITPEKYTEINIASLTIGTTVTSGYRCGCFDNTFDRVAAGPVSR